MSKAHKHAELMKFAADHWHEAEWRWREGANSGWFDWRTFVEHRPGWFEGEEYEVRLMRRTATQPRREIPAPETEAPPIGAEYWLALATHVCDAPYKWRGGPYEHEWLAAGLVYLTKEDRDERVRAMLEIER